MTSRGRGVRVVEQCSLERLTETSLLVRLERCTATG
jgi:hypothetical protein